MFLVSLWSVAYHKWPHLLAPQTWSCRLLCWGITVFVKPESSMACYRTLNVSGFVILPRLSNQIPVIIPTDPLIKRYRLWKLIYWCHCSRSVPLGVSILSATWHRHCAETLDSKLLGSLPVMCWNAENYVSHFEEVFNYSHVHTADNVKIVQIIV